MNSEKQIQLFLEGRLKGNELKAFRKRLEEDMAFKALFKDYQKVWNLIVSQHKKMDKMYRLNERFQMSRNAISPEAVLGEVAIFLKENGIYSSDEEKFKAVINAYFNKKKRKNRRIGFILALAAGILLIVGLPLALMKNHELTGNNQLFNQYFAPYPYLLHERSMKDRDSSLNAKAMFLYNNQDFSEAALILGEQIQDSISVPLQSLYLGICYMELKKYNIAIKTLESIVSLHDHLTFDQANWYLGLTFLKLNQRLNATECLLRVKADSCLFTKQANEILKKIN